MQSVTKPRAVFVWLAAIAAMLISTADVAQSGFPYVLPADFETDAALAAAPATLPDGAGLYLLGSNGYEQIRASANG